MTILFVKALRSLSVLLMKHSSALERLQNELGAGVQQSVEGNQEEELAYFYFIDANALEVSSWVLINDVLIIRPSSSECCYYLTAH